MQFSSIKMGGMNKKANKKQRLILSMLSISFLAVLAISWLWLAAFSQIKLPEGEYVVLSKAEALPQDIPISALTEQGWQSVDLPFHWRSQFAQTRAVWYRLTIAQTELPLVASGSEALWGLYLWRLNQTADIWLNGHKIGSGGNTVEPMARYWNSPLYFEFPAMLWQENNEILIKHYSQHAWGSIEPLILAPASKLKPLYDRRSFVQHDVAQGLFVFVLVTGLFSFTVWFYRRKETEYLWFAIASVALSVYCLNQFLRYLPFDANTWRWLTNVAVDLWAVSLLIFVFRSLSLRNTRVERAAIVYFICGVPLYLFASFYQVFDINIYYHAGSLVLGVMIFNYCFRLYRNEEKLLPLFYCSAIALLFFAGAHDMVMQAVLNNGWFGWAESEFQNHFNSLHFAAPVIFMFIGFSLIKRFIDSMNAVDRLNVDLEVRIGEAREELEENYRAIEKVLVQQSANEERERIYRDLHDDVGSKLLSLYYRLENESDSVLAKSALEDLRDIVSRKSLESCLLRNAVVQWQQEISERVSDAGVALQWEVNNIGSQLMLSELQHTHLRRMLREVLSNALLHSGSITQLHVQMNVQDGLLEIMVANDGAPKPVSAWKSGRGISNLRVRTRDLGGQFRIEDLPGSWVKVSWHVPLLQDKEAHSADTHT